MKEQLQVIYEPQPISRERKAELNAKGYRVVDIVFAPADYVHPEDQEKEPTKRTRKPKEVE